MNIKVSVITAVYNDEKYIQKSVDSILNQTLTDFEYIIVDDGSTDNTLNILNEIAKKDNRVTILTQKNLGPAAARNRAINSAKGVYIALQDSDDISSPTRLQMQLEHLKKSQNNLISCTSYTVIDSDDKVITSFNKIYKNINNNILKGRFPVCHPSIMVLKELISKVNGYNPFYKKAEDYDLIFRLLENGGRFEKINNYLYSLRIRHDSETSMNNGAYSKRIYDNHLRRISNEPENFKEILNDNKSVKNYCNKRIATELFFSENYSKYIKFYLKEFHKLPIKNFIYFIFSLFPLNFKRIIKSKF